MSAESLDPGDPDVGLMLFRRVEQSYEAVIADVRRNAVKFVTAIGDVDDNVFALAVEQGARIVREKMMSVAAPAGVGFIVDAAADAFVSAATEERTRLREAAMAARGETT